MTPFAAAATPHKVLMVLAAVVFLAAGATFATAMIALAGLGQFRQDIDIAAVPGWFWYYRGDPDVRRWIKIGALISAGLVAIAGVAALLRIRRSLHGTARWATASEIAAAGLTEAKGVILGQANGRYLVFGGAEHVMLYAPTRSGKGVGVVIPNLLSWPESLVVLDIKGENWDASAGYRQACGQRVFRFDPLAADGRTVRFNPLAHIDRTDPIRTLDELQKIAQMLFPEPQRADPFWAEAARTGFIGVGAYVAETPALPFTLGEVFRQLTQGSPKTRFPTLIAARARSGHPLSAACVNALTDFCAASDNTFASIRQTITARMGLWLNPRVDAATAASDFDLRSLRDQATSLYLAVSPDNLHRVAPLYNLLLQQLIDLNTRRLPAPGVPGPEVLIVLDEFARIGHAPVLAHGFSFVAGYGIRLLAVIQSPSQLRHEYGPDLADEIMTNCGVEIVFAPKEVKVAQSLSDRLGYYDQPALSRSRPFGLGAGRRTVTTSDQRRALMLPQELLALESDRLIVLKAGIPPVRGRKLRYYAARDFSRRVRPPPTVPALPALQAGGSSAVPPGAPGPASPAEPPAPDLAPFEPASISLAIDDIDLDGLPSEAASEAEVRAWADAYIDRAALEASLELDTRPTVQGDR
ncbi:type IV secretory system conjugative DNA transfer family protein (plasmid) [Brevundimonas staleyi]|uniref:Type IV secretory system conjugative DNA transfer family protein n=1 Tax=Brevundimonas staleyi TaxID=74326 RepID=A0ABW0FP02_9CAUL